ncbi:MAG: hypothetical protein IJY35_05310, partial [Clostridia bacterium]|nr:hypothetical protein [Clostridia bacterium]
NNKEYKTTSNPRRSSSPDVLFETAVGGKPQPYVFCGRSVNKNKVNHTAPQAEFTWAIKCPVR